MDTEDQRDVELSTLAAIFPEIQQVHDDDPYTFVLDVPVNPTKAVTVFFPAAAEAQGPSQGQIQEAGTAYVGATASNAVDSHEISHLPAVRVQLSLPPVYPAEGPPAARVSTTPSWLPSSTAKKLEDDCARLWEDLGRDIVVFAYLDHVQQLADDVFGLVSDVGALQISPEHKIAVLDYDIEAKRVAFENGTFDCGVCLDPKKGAKCHRMIDCGHVFCTECLQSFYNNAIKEGDLAAVRCLEPSCAKERAASQAPGSHKRSKARTFISPSELLQIPLEPDMVKRYVNLKYKTELESDKDTIYCPRPWCQGAARSKKRKKPEGFELHEAEDDSASDTEEQHPGADAEKPGKPKPYVDRLAVCEDCNFAFCSRCYQGWHGDFVVCAPRRDDGELSAEEKASLDFINLHTTPCPTCACPAQKTHGCNHMICYRCQTHFCYLCSAWLDPSNPYQHFNQQPNGRVTSCYMRLWELEMGDEDGQNFFAGGRGPQVPRDEREVAEIALEEAIVGDEGVNHHQFQPQPVLNGNRQRVDVAREGPLVLRIDAGAIGAREGRQVAPPAPAPQQRGGVHHRGRGNPAGGRQQQAAQQGRGGRGRGFVQRQNLNQGPNRGGQNLARRDRHIEAQLRGDAGHEEIQAGEAAWIRHFVQLALNDNEDLIDQED